MTDASELRGGFGDLLTTLHTIDEEYLSAQRHITSADDIADGYRMVLHALQSAVDLFLESDPARPQFKRLISPNRKHTGDNPDVIYYHARINGEHALEIRGQRVGETYLSFTVYGSESGVWSDNITGEINHTEMHFEADESYRVILSAERPGDAVNWIPLAKDSFQVTARHYFESPEPAGRLIRPQAQPSLSRLQEPPSLPRKDAGAIKEALAQMNRYLRAITLERMNIGGAAMPEWFSRQPNTIGQPRLWEQEGDGGGNGTDYIAYAAGFFQLKPGQALIIDGRMPECVYAGVVLCNRYLQSLDYRENRICLNRSNLQIEADGSFRVVVAAENPGHRNWLHTEGRLAGVVYWRFMLPQGDIEPLLTKVIEIAELRGES